VASVLFNTFIFAQIFNLVNSRRINDEYNIFEGESDCRLCQCQVLVTCAAAWWGGLRGGGWTETNLGLEDLGPAFECTTAPADLFVQLRQRCAGGTLAADDCSSPVILLC
jgi:hypothetical protein